MDLEGIEISLPKRQITICHFLVGSIYLGWTVYRGNKHVMELHTTKTMHIPLSPSQKKKFMNHPHLIT